MHEDTLSESMSSAMASNEFVLGQRLLNFDDADCSHLHVLKNCLETYAAKFMVQEVDYPHTRARQINEVNGKGASARYSHLSQKRQSLGNENDESCGGQNMWSTSIAIAIFIAIFVLHYHTIHTIPHGVLPHLLLSPLVLSSYQYLIFPHLFLSHLIT